MTTNEMKKALAQKLADEGTYFTFNDISINKASRMVPTSDWDDEADNFRKSKVEGREIVIKGYEHIHFFLHAEEDDYFGNIVNIREVNYWKGEEISDRFLDFCRTTEEAILALGYKIGNEF